MSEEVQQDTPVESAAPPSPIYRHIPDPIEDIGEAENLAIATSETRRRREQDKQDSGVDSGRAEIHEWSGKDFAPPGEHESPGSQLKRAAQKMTDHRKQALGEAYLKSWGYSPQEAEALAWNAADEAAAMNRKPTEAPLQKVSVVREDGTVALELRDDQPITEELSFRSIQDAKRAMKDYRDLQALEAEQLRAEFAEREHQARVAAAPPASEPTPEPVAQQPQPDPAVTAAQQASQQQLVQAAAFAEYQSMSAQERQAFDGVAAWDKWANSQADLVNPQALAHLVQRAQRGEQKALGRLQELERGRKSREHWFARYQAANESRVSKEIALQNVWQQQQAAAFRTYADQHDRTFRQATPEMKDAQQARALRDATQKMLNGVGFGDAEWKAAWGGQQMINMRDYRVQQVLAKAARYDMLEANRQQNYKSLAEHKAPPVQALAPGAAMARSGQAEEAVAALTRQLDAAPNQLQALRIARRLTQAKREAGQLSNAW